MAIKKSLLLFLLFFMAGILSELFFSYSLRHPQRSILRVNEVMRSKIDDLHVYMDQLSPENSGADFRSFLHKTNQDLFFSEGIAFKITLNDSVVFWSTNHIPESPAVYIHPDSVGMIRLSNGYYYYDNHVAGDYRIHGFILVKNDFPYSNEYLSKAFLPGLNLPDEATISFKEGKYNVYSDHGQFLFSVGFPSDIPVPDYELGILLLLYGIALIALIALTYFSYDALLRQKILLPVLFVADLVILRWILYYFELPPALYDSLLFGPYYFASSGLNQSLGDAFINNIILLASSYLFFSHYKFPRTPGNKATRYAIALSSFIMVFVSYFILIDFYENFILNSSIPITLDRLFSFSSAGIIGLLTLIFATFSFFFFTAKLCSLASQTLQKKGAYVAAVIAIHLVLFPAVLLLNKFDPVTYIFLFAYILSFLLFLYRKKDKLSITTILMMIMLFSFLSNYELNKINTGKEKEYRKLIAEELALERDPVVEYEFRKIRNALLKDSVFVYNLNDPAPPEDFLVDYVNNLFTDRFWKEYEIQVTICNAGNLLEIQPEGYIINCFEYFSEMLREIGSPSSTDSLYFLQDNSVSSNYLAVISSNDSAGAGTNVFIELFSILRPEEGPGYPELLIDRSLNIRSDLANYSYARYIDGALTYKYGPYSYRLDLDSYGDTIPQKGFFSWNDFEHYVYRIEASNILIISAPVNSWLDRIAPYSYFFILFGIVSLLIAITVGVLRGKKPSDLLFGDRFQVLVLSIIIISFAVIGVISERYVISLHDKKNRDLLNEKTLSVLTEIEHKLGDINDWTPELEDYLSEILNKFSQVFFSDINLYDVNGRLISSTRPQIFEEGLISYHINPDAFLELHYDQKLQLIQRERIGLQEYLSSYIPFRNNQDQIMGYLNLPYFARQKELRDELISFLVAYVNIYVLIIVLTIIVTIFISRYITKPLQLLKEKIGKTKLGQLNDKIDWNRDDEIGGLVKEYNRMLDELATSAELLARSERETAWREMAQQIAHEIKNPLTPMKLSVQHLKKAWDDKQPGWEERFEKFTRMIVEQIEALSTIASEFSDFAKMPKAKREMMDLRKSINHAVNLYDETGNITFTVDLPGEPMFLMGDKEQLVRVFNNLIKNSIQAIGKKADGSIEISGRREGENWKVEVSDNGAGIPRETAEKIFSPSFTTKSSGMGLGLAVVQSIVRDSGGVIRFESAPGSGTTFIIHLPVAPQAI